MIKKIFDLLPFLPLASFDLVCNRVYAQKVFLPMKISPFTRFSIQYIHRMTMLIYLTTMCNRIWNRTLLV